MFDGIKKRLTAGVLAAAALTSSVPIPTASAEEGIMPLAEEENQPSSVVLEVGQDCGPMWDANPRSLTFSGDPTIWTANFKLSDGTTVHCYCASKGKGSPNGADYYIAEKVTDWKLASLANISDARSTLAAFLNSQVNKDGVLTAENFPQRAYFAASQIAVWTALGQGRIIGGEDSESHFSWASSTDLKTETGEQAYPADELRITFRADAGTTTEDRLVLYAAIKMLEYAALNGGYWEKLGHAPWVGGAFTYGADYKESGYLNLPTSIAESGKFTEEEYTSPYTGKTQKYWVFPMAASSATFVMKGQITLSAKNLPEGAFLKTTNMEDGSPKVYESRDADGSGVQKLGLHSVERRDEYCENENHTAWGQAFDLYIPQENAEKVTVKSPIELTADMDVARYGAYIAKPKDGDTSLQNMLVVEPGVVHKTADWKLTAQPPEEKVNLKLIKKDADDAAKSLQGAKFKIEWTQNEEPKLREGTTGEDGTVSFDRLPLGATVTITETEPPAGYALMSPNPDKVTLPSTPTETGTFEYTLTDKKDDDTVGLKIIKKDAENATKSLQGAEFKIEYTDAGTPKTLTGTTDANGSLSFTGLPFGAQVTITETNPPAGYKLMSPNPVTKTLPTTPGETGVVEYTFTDQKNPDVPDIPDVQKLSLRVIKVDNGTSVPLKGFTFELYKGASLITSGTTDDNGEIMFTDLEPGDYRVREAGGTEDYAIDAPDQFVTLVKDESEIPTLTFRNDKKRDYRIKKIDAETGAAIPGVVFEIFRDGQSLGQLPPTDANGEVQLEHTEFGTYNVKEVSVPPEYVKSDETFTMEIDKDSQNPFIFTVSNKHKKKLTLKKIDEETGLPMSGVTFDVYLDNNKIGSKTTENGEIVIENAEPGTYRFEETRTLTGYELLRDPINIEMTADKDVVVTAKNHKRHDLIIYKRDATTHALLDGVTFEIFKDEQSLGDFITKNGGKIVVENAEPGTYKAIEKSTLKEYILNEQTTVIEHTIDKDTTVYIDNTHRPGLGIDKRDSVTNQPLENVQFRITYSPDQTPSTDGGNVRTLGDFFTDANGKINLSTETGYNLDEGWYSVTEVKAPAGYIIKEPATQTVHLADGEYKELSFFNQPKSALVIWKYDARTHEALPGARFEVRKLEGTGTGGVAIPGSPFTTGTNGSATVTDLEPGTYIVQEIDSPLGYVKDPTPQTVSIGADEQAVVEVHFANLEDGDVLIKKIDAISKLPLAGVTFDVRKSTGEVVGNSNGKFTTDASGSILIGGVEPDTTLIITEVETISGYILDTTPQTVVTKDGETVFVQFKNQPKGTLIIEKRDSATNKPMRGVTFKITSATGESTEDNEGLTATNGLYKTDENGQIVLHNLNVGNYIVTETATLPGYRIDDPAPKTVVVPSGGTYTVRFNDTPDGSLIIKKIDSVSRGPLAGVEFEVRMIDGTEFKTQTFTTDENGLITLSNLPEGVYSVLETKTIPGYEINREGQEIHIMPGKSETLTFENVPKGGLLIKKIDAVTKEPLSDVVFKATHSDGAVVGASNGEFKTDESGYISIPDLEPDTYIIKEIKTKPNYVLDTTPKTIVVKDHRTYTVEFVNQPDGKIIVEKVDSATKKPLEGVEFEIRTSAGELIGDYPLAEGDSSVGGIGTTTGGGSSSGGASAGSAGQISSNGRYATDANGQIIINHARPGTIVINEIKTIDGYVKIDKPVTVVVAWELRFCGKI